MAATIGFLAADISATNDYVIQLSCGTAAEDPKINPRTRAVAVAQFNDDTRQGLLGYRCLDGVDDYPPVLWFGPARDTPSRTTPDRCTSTGRTYRPA